MSDVKRFINVAGSELYVYKGYIVVPYRYTGSGDVRGRILGKVIEPQGEFWLPSDFYPKAEFKEDWSFDRTAWEAKTSAVKKAINELFESGNLSNEA